MVLRRVLVTGGASGIGAETCRVLAAAGWDPIAADAAASPDVVTLDVTDEAAWDRVLDGVGPLAGLVNCAGRERRVSERRDRRGGPGSLLASKGAVASLTRAAAIEGAPLGVRVNALAPGGVRTPMTAERLEDPAQVAWFGARIPMARVGEPGEVAEVIEFLLSERASYITGEVLYVDGGWHAHA